MKFYNTLTRKKEVFEPIDSNNIRIYACGPTVYDDIHVGNARPLVVFDVLVRLLSHHYYDKVTYVRNITDVDDKINARATKQGISIQDLTKETILRFQHDCRNLKCKGPYKQPLATDHIDDMKGMIATLIEKNHAYVTKGHVLFHVSSMDDYGELSRLGGSAIRAGARVEVADFKRDAADFVLWKPSKDGQPGWESPWGFGRPGWHIECSAMSKKYLGEHFDIHAGGLDLIFPHHENEIAQSRCAHGNDKMANFWMHNGYVTVDGEKMSKSAGNLTTVDDVTNSHEGEAVRYALLAAHYRAPLDFSIKGVVEAKSALDRLYRAVDDSLPDDDIPDAPIDQGVLDALGDDLNTPNALARLHELAHKANTGDDGAMASLKASANLLGLLETEVKIWFEGNNMLIAALTNDKIARRQKAKDNKNFAEADRIRDELAEDHGIILEDTPTETIWRRK
ncbi:MAG: cysteine--tRNA ligase [Candidatus Puniceispirillales bacterium WSBS_2018_MAG_OTU23]